jgi:S-adenosylmethionine:tRNA ribosyltransferase-isomerase
MRGDRVSDYEFHLPPELIAQSPPAIRGDSRLMVVDRATQSITHHTFADIVNFIPSNDVLVRNTTRVMRARLLGKRDSGAPAEVLLLKPIDATRYEAMVHPGGKLKPGRAVHIAPNFDVTILEVTDRRTRIVELHTDIPIADAIEQYGHIPLPPYIERPDTSADAERYQTVYANQIGSVAAPTAGLHFTEPLVHTLKDKGVVTADLILHVGAGTFKPVETEDPTQHVMHEEWYHLPAATADILNTARANNAKIWAVGTTSVRTLESAVHPDGTFSETSGETRIFIYPPYQWKTVDHLLTNFHLPRSTLIMLVAAFAGYDLTMRAYTIAIEERYRFFSYGDAMLII